MRNFDQKSVCSCKVRQDEFTAALCRGNCGIGEGDQPQGIAAVGVLCVREIRVGVDNTVSIFPGMGMEKESVPAVEKREHNQHDGGNISLSPFHSAAKLQKT